MARKGLLALFGLIGLIIGFASPVEITRAQSGFLSFNVNTLSDAVDANVGDGICATAGAVCSLRAAIQEGNAPGTIETFIMLQSAGTYSLTVIGSGEDLAATGDLDVKRTILIQGGGANTHLITGTGGGSGDRVFHIHPGGDLTLFTVGIRSGSTSLNGGGIFVDGGELNAFNVQIGIPGTGNTAAGSGGGLAVLNNGRAELHSSSVMGNGAGSLGGGIAVAEGFLRLIDSTVHSNVGNSGGGGISVNNTSLSVNTGVAIINTTITSNNGIGIGGGLYTNNTRLPQVVNTVIAGNAGTFGPDCAFTNDASNAMVSLGRNLIGNSANCGTLNLGDIITPTINMDAPTVTSGGVQHRKPQTNSPVLHAANGQFCDQQAANGVARPQGPGCDIGSWELAVGFAGAVTADPFIYIGRRYNITVFDADYLQGGSKQVIIDVKVGSNTVDSELAFVEFDNGIGRLSLPTRFSISSPSNGILEFTNLGMVNVFYTDSPDGSGEGSSSLRQFTSAVVRRMVNLTENSSFENDVDNNNVPDDWTAISRSKDKRDCNRSVDPFGCSYVMKNSTGKLTQSIDLDDLSIDLSVGRDFDLTAMIATTVNKPGTLATLLAKLTDGRKYKCKITLDRASSGLDEFGSISTGAFEFFRCNIETDDGETLKSMKVTLSTAALVTGKVYFDDVTVEIFTTFDDDLPIGGLRSSEADTRSPDAPLPLPAAPDGWRG